ncbi:hypothetical protein R3P38DRAFT_3227977 [Favolaschia claudopus]|uniref:Uncharacterized protein n=1 Tax=Favolaschia claudopus TaxID=2862362 RepID=A0AAV9ZSH9_9AGAR
MDASTVAARHDSPFAEPGIPPPPVMLLLIHTDFNTPVLPGLLIHEDLEDHDHGPGHLDDSAPGSKVRFVDSVPVHSYPPPPILPKRIPRPAGLSRDTLEHLTGWPKVELDRIKKRVEDLADDHLNTTVCYSDQDKKLLDLVYKMASIEFYALNNYEDHWVTETILQRHLKNTSERHKRALKAEVVAAASRTLRKRRP